MSEWNLIEQTLQSRIIPVRMTVAERRLVEEALTSTMKRSIEEGNSAWSVLQRLVEASMQMAVKGLTPHEAEIIKRNKLAKDAPTKTGNTGMVMMLDPKSWLQIKQEMEANPEYYDMLGGGVVDASSVAKKIGGALELTMGKKPAQEPQRIEEPHGLALGKAFEMTPAIQDRPTVFQKDIPGGVFDPPKASKQGAEDPAARRKRVAAQDMAMMGAKSQSDIGKMSKASNVSVKDAYDRMEEDMTAEGIGKWARSAMAAGALGLAGDAMAGDNIPSSHALQQGQKLTTQGSLGMSKPDKHTRVIDYQKGYQLQPGEYHPHEPMGGLEPEKKPWSNENVECPEEMHEEGGEGQPDVLTKKTGYAHSISLTQDEFDAVMAGQYRQVDVVSTSGKRMKSIPGSALAKTIQRGGAKLRQVEDDPANPHFWVVKI